MWEKVRKDGEGDTVQGRPFVSPEPEEATGPWTLAVGDEGEGRGNEEKDV